MKSPPSSWPFRLVGFQMYVCVAEPGVNVWTRPPGPDTWVKFADMASGLPDVRHQQAKCEELPESDGERQAREDLPDDGEPRDLLRQVAGVFVVVPERRDDERGDSDQEPTPVSFEGAPRGLPSGRHFFSHGPDHRPSARRSGVTSAARRRTGRVTLPRNRYLGTWRGPGGGLPDAGAGDVGGHVGAPSSAGGSARGARAGPFSSGKAR